jgi:hypothetical protein
VDANAVGDLTTPSEDGAPVLKWLLTGGGALIIGGKLRREITKSLRMQATLVVLNQAGKLHDLNDETVEVTSQKIKRTNLCCSNDPHVIAAAVVSGCRLIFTKDKDLHKDAKNKSLLNPSASIYQSKDHKHLLTQCYCS